ncbi:MAG: molybdenum cofactor biosynthesis protein MoaE [Pseudomonadales bacterium]|nr:molybdenum cofactor biosynthesis protein MoaE [Pseudomonadales bacterium]
MSGAGQPLGGTDARGPGAADPCPVCVRVETADFSVADEYRSVRERLGGRAGAIATFVGLVRDLAGDGPVGVLELEHYPGMTERSIAAIVDQAVARWPLLDVVVIHRVGALHPTEQIVYVQVASGHRAAAFAACEFIMDYLKTEAVFWKRESGPAGQRWIESTGEDRARLASWSNDAPADGGHAPTGAQR